MEEEAEGDEAEVGVEDEADVEDGEVDEVAVAFEVEEGEELMDGAGVEGVVVVRLIKLLELLVRLLVAEPAVVF